MATKVTAARLLVLDAADRLDAGRRCDLEAGMAKLFASEIAMQVALDALRVHGGSAHPPEGPPPAPRLWLVTAFFPAPPQGVRRQYVAEASFGSDPSSGEAGRQPGAGGWPLSRRRWSSRWRSAAAPRPAASTRAAGWWPCSPTGRSSSRWSPG